MALVTLDSLTASPSVSTSAAGGLSGVLSSASITSQGTYILLTLDTVQNVDANSGTDEFITLTLTAVVTNVAGNQANTLLTPSLTFTLTGVDTSGSATTATLVEPEPSFSLLLQTPDHADAGDTSGIS
jgi:hypothetical protein